MCGHVFVCDVSVHLVCVCMYVWCVCACVLRACVRMCGVYVRVCVLVCLCVWCFCVCAVVSLMALLKLPNETSVVLSPSVVTVLKGLHVI